MSSPEHYDGPVPPPWDEDAADDAYEAAVNAHRLAAEELDRLRARHTAKRLFDQEQASATNWDELYLNADQLDQLPSHDPLISRVIDRHSYVILRGRDDTFKSFIVLDWSFCLATGKPWQGHEVEQSRVLYIAGEGAYGIYARKAAWENAWSMKIPPDQFTLRQEAVNLYAGGPALEELLTRVETGRYGLVVIDTLRRASGQAKENTSEMGLVIDNVERIKRATTNGSVMVISHTDKTDSDSRGYSGIEDDADIVWRARRDEERHPLAVDLTNTKMKNGPDGREFNLVMSPSLDSLVVSNRGSHGHAPAAEANYETDEQILATMRETFATTGASASALREVTGISKSTLYKARGRLLNSGQLVARRKGGSDYLYLPETGVESTVDSTPGFHGSPHPPSDPDSTAVHGDAEHDSTAVHTESTAGFHGSPHPAPCLEDRGGVDNPVDSVETDPDECPTCHRYTCNHDHTEKTA